MHPESSPDTRQVSVSLAEIEQACRDLGWHVICHQTPLTDRDPQYVAQIVAGTAPDALIVGRGTSSVSAGQAIQLAWGATRETLGARLVHCSGGAVRWDGGDFSKRNRWHYSSESGEDSPS